MPWSVPFDGYESRVKAFDAKQWNNSYADFDPPMDNRDMLKAIKWHQVETIVERGRSSIQDRTSFLGKYTIHPETLLPLNPMGRTGIKVRYVMSN